MPPWHSRGKKSACLTRRAREGANLGAGGNTGKGIAETFGGSEDRDMARKIVMRDDIIDENYSDPLGVADDLRRIALPIGGTRTLVISDSKLEGQRLIG